MEKTVSSVTDINIVMSQIMGSIEFHVMFKNGSHLSEDILGEMVNLQKVNLPKCQPKHMITYKLVENVGK